MKFNHRMVNIRCMRHRLHIRMKIFDQTALADGIIVYRVNPTYKDEGNLRGNDYIYVYRTNDTSITASAG